MRKLITIAMLAAVASVSFANTWEYSPGLLDGYVFTVGDEFAIGITCNLAPLVFSQFGALVEGDESWAIGVWLRLDGEVVWHQVDLEYAINPNNGSRAIGQLSDSAAFEILGMMVFGEQVVQEVYIDGNPKPTAELFELDGFLDAFSECLEVDARD